MALTRPQKEAKVAQAEQDLSDAAAVVFVTYNALTVNDLEELRDKLHAENAAVRVLPKRLLRLVLQKTGVEFDPLVHAGQIAVVWGSDAVTPAKVLHTFAKNHPQVELVAGTLEGKLLALSEVKALALLPSHSELLAQLVSTLVNPLRGFQTILRGAQRQAVYVLSAIAEQKSAQSAGSLK
ncbi:MAG: 50S ribosomal protein L10 [Candidatus Andersenbacteria bacterium]